MKIRMLTAVAGAGFNLAVGDETERFTEAEAARMIASKSAEPVGIETAEDFMSFETPEAPRGRKKGKR